MGKTSARVWADAVRNANWETPARRRQTFVKPGQGTHGFHLDRRGTFCVKLETLPYLVGDPTKGETQSFALRGAFGFRTSFKARYCPLFGFQVLYDFTELERVRKKLLRIKGTKFLWVEGTIDARNLSEVWFGDDTGTTGRETRQI